MSISFDYKPNFTVQDLFDSYHKRAKQILSSWSREYNILQERAYAKGEFGIGKEAYAALCYKYDEADYYNLVKLINGYEDLQSYFNPFGDESSKNEEQFRPQFYDLYSKFQEDCPGWDVITVPEINRSKVRYQVLFGKKPENKPRYNLRSRNSEGKVVKC